MSNNPLNGFENDGGTAVLPRPGEHSLLHIAQATHQSVPLSPAMQWFNQPLGQFVQGGVYTSGRRSRGQESPGLVLQLSLDLAKQGVRCLHVLTEEPASRLKERAIRMTGEWSSCEAGTAMGNLMAETSLADIESLPTFFMQNILSSAGKYHGARFIVLDSIQGCGLSSAASKKYARLYEFTRLCQSAGITTLLIGHVTKNGSIQGPRDLEHNVDAVIQLCKAIRFRAIAVPKNRFGPAMNRPLSLILDDVTTNLHVSPHAAPITSIVRSYLPATEKIPIDVNDIAELQCSVKLPDFGSRGKVTAPGVPNSEVLHLLQAIGQMPEMELAYMDFTIHAHLPEGRRFSKAYGLPLAMALISSYLQRPIPDNHLYVGEVDLCRKVRALPLPNQNRLVTVIKRSGQFDDHRIFCSPVTAAQLKAQAGVEGIIGCDTLEQVIQATWPEIG